MRGAGGALALIAVLAGAALSLVTWQRGQANRRLRLALAADIERGADMDLRRAQALARRLVLDKAADAEAGAALAFTSAVLATDFGVEMTQEAEAVALHAAAGRSAADPSAAIATAARALIAWRQGQREAAARMAAEAASSSAGLPHPLYALGRVRALGGDLLGASRALEAAIVDAPAFTAAKVAWAEVRLDLGDAPTAMTTLRAVLAGAPGNTRARLLLEEAWQALPQQGTGAGQGEGAALESACGGARPVSTYEAAGCDLAYAVRARLGGRRGEALARGLAAARAIPDEPRALARLAQVLAELGAVDAAGTLVSRAARYGAPTMPALAWAQLAVALGRGRAAAPPAAVRPAGPGGRLLEARAALAVGGVGALAAVLAGSGPAEVARDPSLRLLATLGARRAPASAPTGDDDPVHAYVDGLRARLAGDLPTAAERLRHALAGHGDACRAAGEYVASLRALKQRPPPGVFAPLREENAACVNLPVGP